MNLDHYVRKRTNDRATGMLSAFIDYIASGNMSRTSLTLLNHGRAHVRVASLKILGLLRHALLGLIAVALIPTAQAGSFLWDAITDNDLGKAKTLIALGADVNQKNSIGNPITHHAVSSGNPELVKLLIAKGADVNAKGQFDRVALHYANKKGMAKILLTHGAIIDAPTNFGETPLHWAAEGVNGFGQQVDLLEFADVLIAHGADVNKKAGEGRSYRPPLSYAAASNNLPIAKLLIGRGADVEGGGSSPLSFAGANGDFVEMAQLLVENGADVNRLSRTGWSPLMTAAGRGNIKVTRYLLAQGADPNAVGREGLTALYAAAGSDYGYATAEVLLRYGADPNAKYMQRRTALDQAASQRALKIVKLLLANGAVSDGRNATTKSVIENIERRGTHDVHMPISVKKPVVMLRVNPSEPGAKSPADR